MNQTKIENSIKITMQNNYERVLESFKIKRLQKKYNSMKKIAKY